MKVLKEENQNMFRKESNYDLYTFQKVGTLHKNENVNNEDLIHIEQKNDSIYFCIADGQSGKRYCKEGAKICLEKVIEYVSQYEFEEFYCFSDYEQHKVSMMNQIEMSLKKEAIQKDTQFEEFSSTFIVLITDRKMERYILIHLGDGSVIGITKEGKTNFLSRPENGININTTWYTTSILAASHIKICKGDLQDMSKVLMVTDGAICINSREHISMRFQRICTKEPEQIFDYIQQYNSIGDSSYILLSE